MPDLSPADRAWQERRVEEIDRILISLDTLARVADYNDARVVADACDGLARFLKARSAIEAEKPFLISGPMPTPASLAASPDATASAQPASPAPAAPTIPAAPVPAATTAPGGPPCEEQLQQQRDPARRMATAKNGLTYLSVVNYYLQLAAAKQADKAAVADAVGSIDCLPVPHASVVAGDLADGQAVWDQCYAALQDLKTAGVVDGDDEAGILYALGDRPGTVRIVPGDERDPVADDEAGMPPSSSQARGVGVLPPAPPPPPEGSVL